MTSEQCCGRLKGRLVHEKGNLARLARQAAIRTGKGLLVTDELRAEIAEAKQSVATIKDLIDEHDADHAGVPEAVAS